MATLEVCAFESFFIIYIYIYIYFYVAFIILPKILFAISWKILALVLRY